MTRNLPTYVDLGSLLKHSNFLIYKMGMNKYINKYSTFVTRIKICNNSGI